MEWTRTETIALAVQSCVQCNGLGLRSGNGDEPSQPCNCVLRSIFRACYARFRECVSQEKYVSSVSHDAVQGRDKKGTWGRKDEEYVADFGLVSRRSLSDEEYRIFNYHFLLGADWRLCCRKLKMDRGTFFHAVYRIQQRLGRVFHELEPYALYPLNEYFHGECKKVTSCRIDVGNVVPIRPPVRRQSPAQPVRRAA